MRCRPFIILFLLVVAALLLARPAGSPKVRGLMQNLQAQVIPSPRLELPYPAPPPPEEWDKLGAAERLASTRQRLLPKLNDELAAKACKLGQPVFVRVFKETNELELWLQPGAGKAFQLFRLYPIAVFSGTLGPKTQEGDLQAPEGFYAVTKSLLNPASRYHLSFNIGYPNEYDRHHQRTGNLIMVHGRNVSIGCFAMTDPVIEEIYLIVEAALNAGQRAALVHVFPFRMTEERMTAAETASSPWLEFWKNLKQGHDWFEEKKLPPVVSLQGGKYAIRP